MEDVNLGAGLQQAIEELAEVSAYIWDRGWTAANGGNLSCDVTDAVSEDAPNPQDSASMPLPVTVPHLAGRTLFVTSSGSRFRDVERKPDETLILLRIDGTGRSCHVVWGGKGKHAKPTLEFIPHLKIHDYLRASGRPEKAVVHTHPVHLISMTHMPAYGTQEFVRLLHISQSTAKAFLASDIGMVGYMPGGSEELADETVKLLHDHPAVLWDRHGCIAVGEDAWAGFDIIDMLDKAAEMFLHCRSAGIEPKWMTDEERTNLGL
jgi:rhamnulose-1-phosphate aldolase